MAAFNKISLLVLVAGAFIFQGCNKSLVVKNVNYAQQLETVLVPDSNGDVNDVRHGISYSILPFQFEEFQDTSSVQVTEVRMIRNSDGYYFITADKFKHVYVMAPKQGELKLKKKILVDEQGLLSPAFNWRAPDVQLVNKQTNEVYLMNEEGISNNTEKEEEAKS